MREIKTKLPYVWSGMCYDGFMRNPGGLGVLAECRETLSLYDVLFKPGRKPPRFYDPDAVAEMIESPVARRIMEDGQMYGYLLHKVRDAGMRGRNKIYVSAVDARIDADGLKVTQNVPASRTVAISFDGRFITHHQQILDTIPGRVLLSLMANAPPEFWGWSWATSGIGCDAAIARPGTFGGFDWVYDPAFPALWQAQLLRESGMRYLTYQVPPIKPSLFGTQVEA